MRGWRSTLIGAGTAGAVLVLVVALLGPALQRIPIQGLRLVVGALLLAFGLQWLKKAILRSSGYKALHDEDEAFREGQAQAAAGGARAARGAGLVRVHRRVQGRPARGPRGRVHRDRVRERAGAPGPRGRRRRRGAGRRARRGRGRARPLVARAREHDQVRRRTAAHERSVASGPPRAPASTGPGTSSLCSPCSRSSGSSRSCSCARCAGGDQLVPVGAEA